MVGNKTEYILKCARFDNPSKEDAQVFGTITLFEDDDFLIEDIINALEGVRDCTYYYDRKKN